MSCSSSDEPKSERDRCVERQHGIQELSEVTAESLVGTWGECTVCDPDCDGEVFEACHYFEDGTMVWLDPATMDPLTERTAYRVEQNPTYVEVMTEEDLLMIVDIIHSDTALGWGPSIKPALTCPGFPPSGD